MPKYLFTNDQRTSSLEDCIQQVANCVLSGKKIKDISDKSENNNSATLEFYYNLYPDTENTKIALTSAKEVIRNFILKFQYPNTRTSKSFYDSLSDGVYLAPYRMTISLLIALSKAENSDQSFFKLEEILYYVFADRRVYMNPAVDCKKIALSILKDRKEKKELSPLIENCLKWQQKERQIREMMTVLCKVTDSFKISKGILTYSHISTDDDFLNKIIKYNFIWVPSNKNNFEQSNLEYISYMNIANTPYTVVQFNNEHNANFKQSLNKYALQQIYYGAPGTGKSFAISKITKGYHTIRSTFHPDSDYSSFVGTYKPTMTTVPLRDSSGKIIEGVEENRITYTFVKQAFLKAYLSAWKLYTEGNDSSEPQFLIIEEINRGNCAQIFGDLFQLLDRNENGFSSYPIEADADIQKAIEKAFTEEREYEIEGELSLEGAISDYTSNYGNTLSEDILHGRVLLLPNNLYIWATMNTSDQSLFPIDSAFKRRWDWKYVRITNEYEHDNEGKCILDETGAPVPLGWKIIVDNESYDWWLFVQSINKEIANKTDSDDKKIGYFFCKAKNKVIDCETFVGKVIFYLWNDVFKDETVDIFNIDGVGQTTFDQFYKEDVPSGSVKPDGSIVKQFIKNVIDKQSNYKQ